MIKIPRGGEHAKFENNTILSEFISNNYPDDIIKGQRLKIICDAYIVLNFLVENQDKFDGVKEFLRDFHDWTSDKDCLDHMLDQLNESECLLFIRNKKLDEMKDKIFNLFK